MNLRRSAIPIAKFSYDLGEIAKNTLCPVSSSSRAKNSSILSSVTTYQSTGGKLTFPGCSWRGICCLMYLVSTTTSGVLLHAARSTGRATARSSFPCDFFSKFFDCTVNPFFKSISIFQCLHS